MVIIYIWSQFKGNRAVHRPLVLPPACRGHIEKATAEKVHNGNQALAQAS